MADAPVVVESLEGIPEPLHAHFAKVEVDGAERYEYRPPRENVDGLKSAKGKIEREAERLKGELKALQDRYAIDGELPDPDEIRALLDERKAREGKEMIARTDAEKEKAELREKIQASLKKDLDAKDKAIGDLQSTLHTVLIDGGISRTAQSADTPFRLRKGGAEALIKIARADGVFRVIDGKPVPFDGDRPMEKADGSPATMLDWMAKTAADYGLIEDSQGTGSEPPLNGSAPKMKRSEMNRAQKIAYIQKYGEDKYAALPE